MKENIILEEQVIQGFTEFEGGLWVLQVPSPLPPFTEGATYRVLWGETYFTCIAANLDGVITLGNLFLADSTYEDTKEPFLSCVIPAEVSGNTTDMLLCVTTDEGSSHRAGITQLIEEDIPDNTIKLKGYSGRETEYADVPKIWLDAPESTAENPVLVPFTYGEAIEGVEILPDFSSGDQTISMPKGYLAHSAVVKKPENLIPENVKLGETIAGIPGTYDPKPETEELSLDAYFLYGDMVVEPSTGKYLTKVILKKPSTLVPKNIAKDVEIAGVVGSHEGGSAGDLPKLYDPSGGYFSTSNGRKYMYVSNPYTSNGRFPQKIVLTQVQEDGTIAIIGEHLLSTTTYTSTANVYAEAFYPGVYKCKPRAHLSADKFLDSGAIGGGTTVELSQFSYELENISISSRYSRAFVGDQLSMTLVPASGYYLPREILVKDTPKSTGEPTTPEFEYNPDTGLLSFVAETSGDMFFKIIAESMPWLKTPELLYASPNLSVNFIDPKAQSTPVKCNGETAFNLVDGRTGYLSHEVEEKPSGFTYGFSLQSDGYYKEGSSGSTYRVAGCKVYLEMKTAGNVTFSFVNYGYSSYDYGIISKVDCNLSTSYSTDIDTSSSNVYTTYKSSNSTSVRTVTMSVPAGKHFICFKYRRYYSSSASYYFKFKVSSTAASPTVYNLGNYFDSYGVYPLMIQSVADGYTPSLPIEYTFENKPTVSVSNAVLTVRNLKSSVLQVKVVVDGENIATLDHDGSGSATLDLSPYGFSIAKHLLYVNVVMSDGSEYRSDTLADGVLFAYSSFANASWDEIGQVSRAGLAKKLYTIGSTKTLVLGSSSLTVAIAGFDHDDLANGEGKAGLTLVTMNVPSSSYVWGGQYTYGSTYCTVTKTLNSWYNSSIPSDLKANIQKVTKEIDGSYTSGTNDMSTIDCNLFCLSFTELGLDISVNTQLRKVGERYELFPFSTTMPTVTQVGTSTVREYWARQMYRFGVCNAGYVTTSGSYSNVQSSSLSSAGKYIRFGFCL